VSKQSSAQRRRGVRASRLKLTRALNEAGLPTQVALAERIADQEDLESVPKDMVNRAFRELSVEIRSLDRIAHALGVEAHTLYKTADELERDVTAAQPVAAPWHAGARAGMLAVFLAAIAVAAIWLYIVEPWSNDPAGGSLDVAQPLTLGDGALLVLPLVTPDGHDLTPGLRAALSRNFNVATPTALAAADTADLAGLAQRLRLDVILDGEFVTQGRLTAVRVFAFANGVRQQVWGESLPSPALPTRLEAIAGRIAAAVRRTMGLADRPVPHFPLAPVQDDYLMGQVYLDEPASELNLKRAQTRFESALRQDSNYARAHAGLCHALLEAHWMLEEDRMLQDASRACSQALLLDPEDPVVATAHAYFLRRTGRNDEAIARYKQVTASDPVHTPALEGLSASYLDAYRQEGDRAFLERAIAAARRAADADPTIWKPLFSLASMYWFDGNLRGAIAASEEALSRDENEYVLANLGTFYVCAGAFEPARDAYLRARDLAPGSYVGDEFLGMVYYFLGDYDESVRLRERAIGSIGDGAPEIHEMWGHLGDAYRAQGNAAGAVDAYQRAAAIAERDHLRGTIPAADQAARAYYYTVLQSLDPGNVPERVQRQIDAELEQIEAAQVEATAHRRLAQIWLLRGDRGRARQALARATSTCPGYARLPDLQPLRDSVAERTVTADELAPSPTVPGEHP